MLKQTNKQKDASLETRQSGEKVAVSQLQPERASKGGDARQRNKGVLAEAFLLEEIYCIKLDPAWQKLFLLQLG